jgi:hypothetical protein
LKNAEVDTTIAAVFHKMRMLGEIVVLAVFEDENTIGL